MRVAVALVILLLSVLYQYLAPQPSKQATAHEKTQPVALAHQPATQEAARVPDAPESSRQAKLPVAIVASDSPIDFKHIIGADYKRHTGEPTGGHTLLNGDVRVIEGTESAPDASGVYRAQVQMADPQHPGQWITKTDRNDNPMPNTMFPKHWTAEQVVNEVNAAWFSPTKTIRGEKWSALTPSGVRVEGYLEPRVTAYPVYSKRH
jgi:hypothetical protein